MKFVYSAEPTPARFHADDSDVRYIEGPWGSGKTTACLMELIKLSMEQQPDANNIRRTRWAIVRNTYPELKSTTIKSFQAWVPHSVAPVVFSVPITSKFVQRMPDGTTVDIEFVFMALDTPEDVAKLLSLELTGAYINEGREIPWEVLEAIIGRTDRFPQTIKDETGKTIYGPTRPCVIVDSNPPKTSHFLHTLFNEGDVKVTEVKRGEITLRVKWTRFKQPPAVFKNDVTGAWELNPDAENLSHLGDNYYVRQMALGEEHIRVNLAGEPGMSRKGKPIFAKFSHHKHVAKQILVPKRGTSILMGVDFGLTPAVVVAQLTYQGLQLLDELPATDESLEDFLDEQVIPLLRSKYNGYQIVACGDPAGGQRSGLNKMTAIGVMRARGIKTYPAITNAFQRRKEAVDWFLGRDNGFLVDPRLNHIIEAMAAGYVWKETKSNGGQILEVANKNEYSHIADAIEYLALYARYGGGQLSRPDGGNSTPQATLGASAGTGGGSGGFLWA